MTYIRLADKEYWCFKIADDDEAFACCECRRITRNPVGDRCEHCGHPCCEMPDAVSKVDIWPEEEDLQ